MNKEKGSKARYKTTNRAAYDVALKARGSLTIWLDKDMQWYAPASVKRGHQHIFSEAAIQFCLSIKCLFGLALRQSLGFVESLLRMADLSWRVPDYSTVCRRQKTLRVQLPYRASTSALDLLVVSTGIKFLGEDKWKRKKHGAEYRRQWRKVHLGIGSQTLEIRAIEVTDNSVGDAPMLPELLGQIPPDEAVASVSGDGAYDTKACHAAILERRAQAVISPRKNARPWTVSLARGRWRATRRSGRAKDWGAASGRSGAATTAEAWWRPKCIASSTWASGSMARMFERQVVELHVRVALLQPLHATGAASDRACGRHGAAASGVRVISSTFRLVQQSLDLDNLNRPHFSNQQIGATLDA